MYSSSKILIGELRMDDWLREEMLDYIEKNPCVMDVDIYKHFKMRVDIIATVLADLRIDGEIERVVINGGSCYSILKFTKKELRDASLPTPIGNFNLPTL